MRNDSLEHFILDLDTADNEGIDMPFLRMFKVDEQFSRPEPTGRIELWPGDRFIDHQYTGAEMLAGRRHEQTGGIRVAVALWRRRDEIRLEYSETLYFPQTVYSFQGQRYIATLDKGEGDWRLTMVGLDKRSYAMEQIAGWRQVK